MVMDVLLSATVRPSQGRGVTGCMEPRGILSSDGGKLVAGEVFFLKVNISFPLIEKARGRSPSFKTGPPFYRQYGVPKFWNYPGLGRPPRHLRRNNGH
jgi:hypothetical protein